MIVSAGSKPCAATCDAKAYYTRRLDCRHVPRAKSVTTRLIRRERLRLAQNLVALFRGTIERVHHQVKVRGES